MAYASLVSLTNTLHENIQLNLIPPNSQTLLQDASLFQEFLKKYSSDKSSEKIRYLESRIRDAAYKAQDTVDSYVADRFDQSAKRLSSLFEEPEDYWEKCFFKDLDEVNEEINSIKQEMMQITEKDKDKEEKDNNEPHIQSSILLPASSSRPPSHGMTTMVGLDDHLKDIKIRLVSGSSQREIVALVGMGGIGKTTLAKKLYEDKSILCHFHICCWATVSQEHNVRNILLHLLDSMGKLTDELHPEQKEKLAEVFYKSLKHRRYLIVLDDVWDTQVWDYLKRILTNDENGSRILLTTRLKKVAEYDNNCPPHHVRFLNDKEAWDLFCERVFGHNRCPLELEKVGKEIVRNCRGLPLEVNVIGGHLSKATRTPQHWRSVAKNLSETIALEDGKQCSSVLSLSYKYLPHHLKGCFLYMSIFPEDYEIKVSLLLHFWIASGLIIEERFKSFEDVARDYFLDLVERNLILVSQCKYNGKIFSCKIHDLIRDLCIKEAKGEKFFHVVDRTLHHDFHYIGDHVEVPPGSRPLRALYLKPWKTHLLSTMENQLTNTRFLYYEPDPRLYETALLTYNFLHLHTIHVFNHFFELNIWEMPQLRHVKITLYVIVPDPPATKIDGENSVIVLEKLQTLSHVRNLIFTDEVLQRIQNIKKLGVEYLATNSRDLGLNNLERLHKLESLRCCFYNGMLPGHGVCFPPQIKKLTLEGSCVPWKDMTVVGSLPNLEVLKLKHNASVGEEWEPNEEEFLNLKTLHLEFLDDLVHWRAEAIHFPILQHLFICDCTKLLEIPSAIGEIPTLQLIDVVLCRSSVATSARQIKEEQWNFGNEDLRVITLRCF